MGSLIGIDEVGRGCWAGPLLVVAARQISELPKALRDSKLMSKKQREDMFNKLAPFQNLSGAVGNRIAEHQVFGAGLSITCQFGEGWVSPRQIDQHGLAKALRLGVSRALKHLGAKLDEQIIIDGKVNYVAKKFIYSRALVNADNTVPIVSAASVYAKVKRDAYMAELSQEYPNYSFENHVGYGTKAHLQALNDYGVIELVHRTSFSPIAKLQARL